MRPATRSLLAIVVLTGCGTSEPAPGDAGRDRADAPAVDGPTADAWGLDAADDDAPAGDAPAGDAIAQDAPADAPTDGPPRCPDGVGSRWTCDAAGRARVRCQDGVTETVACEFGCNPPAAGASDATCSCGPNGHFTLWNCTADGDLHTCRGGAYLTRSCEGRGCRAQPLGVDDVCNAPPGATLQPVLDRLGAECGRYSPGTTCGLAVRDLTTGETAHYAGDRWYVSASSAKAVWVAAALHDASIAAVEPYARPIFERSDNSASGRVIDLLSSPNRVNTFMWNEAGMANSGFCRWNIDRPRNATNCPRTAGGDNFFTANDAVEFLTRLWNRTLLSAAATDAELRWMLWAPRSGYGGWLGTQLPAGARATMRHKAGWLPPTEVPGYSNSNEIGIVEVGGGRAYAVATLMNGGSNYNGRQLPVMEYVSCVIYHAVARDVADPFAGCGHP